MNYKFDLFYVLPEQLLQVTRITSVLCLLQAEPGGGGASPTAAAAKVPDRVALVVSDGEETARDFEQAAGDSAQGGDLAGRSIHSQGQGGGRAK